MYGRQWLRFTKMAYNCLDFNPYHRPSGFSRLNYQVYKRRHYIYIILELHTSSEVKYKKTIETKGVIIVTHLKKINLFFITKINIK